MPPNEAPPTQKPPAKREKDVAAPPPAPALSPPAATMTAGLEAHDRRTHVERINPGDNPAHVPGLGAIH